MKIGDFMGIQIWAIFLKKCPREKLLWTVLKLRESVTYQLCFEMIANKIIFLL